MQSFQAAMGVRQEHEIYHRFAYVMLTRHGSSSLPALVQSSKLIRHTPHDVKRDEVKMGLSKADRRQALYDER